MLVVWKKLKYHRTEGVTEHYVYLGEKSKEEYIQFDSQEFFLTRVVITLGGSWSF
jgi:hypothetical protein